MRLICFTLVIAVCALRVGASSAADVLAVDASKPVHTMAFGFGQNWHIVGEIANPKVEILGSAWGGVPSSTDEPS